MVVKKGEFLTPWNFIPFKPQIFNNKEIIKKCAKFAWDMTNGNCRPLLGKTGYERNEPTIFIDQFRGKLAEAIHGMKINEEVNYDVNKRGISDTGDFKNGNLVKASKEISGWVLIEKNQIDSNGNQMYYPGDKIEIVKINKIHIYKIKIQEPEIQIPLNDFTLNTVGLNLNGINYEYMGYVDGKDFREAVKNNKYNEIGALIGSPKGYGTKLQNENYYFSYSELNI